MNEFTSVISSSARAEQDEAAVSEACPREFLGLTCIINEYSCLCEQVSGCQVETLTNQKGEARELMLSMTLIPNMGEPSLVMTGIDLTGLRAKFGAVSRQAVRASFDLMRPENAALAMFVRETAL